MENCQRALNYETVVSVLKKEDSYCLNLFNQIAKECDVRESLPINIKTYSKLLNIETSFLNDSYIKCRSAFSLLDKDVQIIDQNHPLWPSDVDGIPFLYLKGNISLLRSRGISIVGTLSPSDRAKFLTQEVVNSLGASDFVIISGLAIGIDGISHIQALSKEYKTIAVLGTSLCDVYPKQHEKLQNYIAQHGLLVSQFAPSRETQRHFLMQRNVLMSQMSQGIFIIEERDGGIGVKQAQYCEKEGKKVFVLKETYENRTFLWPRQLKDPIIVNSPASAGATVKKSVRLSRAFGRTALKDTQPSLF